MFQLSGSGFIPVSPRRFQLSAQMRNEPVGIGCGIPFSTFGGYLYTRQSEMDMRDGA